MKHGIFAERKAIKIMENVVSALSHIHSRGVGHLDVKPSNIMLRNAFNANIETDGPDTDVCLLDFGLAVRCPHPLMLSAKVYRSVRGTPVYTAPEVSSGLPYAIEKADIWSCGITLFELLSGTVPYEPEDQGGGFSAVTTVINQVGSINNLYSEPNCSSSSKVPPLSSNCRKLLQSFLQISPDARPTAKEALQMLQEIKESFPAFESGIT